MKIIVVRDQCNADCTTGQLFIDDKFQCFTLEDVVRDPGVKIHGQTAIPVGTYRVAITPSPRFKRDLPLLEDVPGFSGVRIHPGNTAEDTEGCLLVGTQRTAHQVLNSRVAFEALFVRLQAAQSAGEPIELEITTL